MDGINYILLILEYDIKKQLHIYKISGLVKISTSITITPKNVSGRKISITDASYKCEQSEPYIDI